MKRFLMMCALVASVVGCGQLQIPKVIVVTPLNEQDVLDAKAAALIAANSEIVADDTDAQPAECLCGGTGRSGDGLGPCACPDGCACHKKSASLEAEPEVDPVEETAIELEVEEAPTAESEQPAVKALDLLTDMEGRIARVLEVNNGLLEVSEALGEKTGKIQTDVQDLDKRVAALEAAKVVSTTAPGAKNESPNRQLILLYTDKDLSALDAWETEHGSKLIDVGWSIGADESFQIVKVRIESPEAGEFRQALDLAKQHGTPYWSVYGEQKFERGSVGLPGAVLAADMLNGTTTQKATGASSSSAEPWRSIPETWPARVPISRSTTPSKETLIWHLRGGGTGGENHRHDEYASWPLESMTVGQLVTLHDRDHDTPVRQTVMQIPRVTVMPQPMRFVPRGGGVSYRTKTCINGRCF